MTTAMSMLMIRKALNTFCEDHELSIKSAAAADAAKYLIKINSDEIPSITKLRSLLEAWIEERALSA
ncbi:hypothetical protein JNB91_14510 [Rhizobium wenxiniae]|uniref:hypothetical protein n=1 Tax=Rhizobium wenxiniae TaxID=1737357 RepID=UPI001C6E8FFD|nr:hypothetical protein [Rhizobium wenxiniae]MBW9089052.1 hypothetical protein [Rhizobium wenxiniae]